MCSWTAEFSDKFVGQTVLVTGATGFIGGHLCEALVTLGAQVHGFSLDGTGYIAQGCRFRVLDLRDFDKTKQALLEIRPSIIYHLAGLVTASQRLELVVPMLQNNLVGTVHLLVAVANTECQRLVVAGSSEESSLAGCDYVPASPYEAAKAASTAYCRMFHRLYDLPVVVVRPFLTYGPRQDPTKLIPYTILSLLNNENPALNSGERVCDFLYVLDLICGLLKAGIQPNIEGHVIDLGTGQGTRIRDVVDLLTELCVSVAQPVFGGVPDRVGERPLIADAERTRRVLGWTATWSLREGLAKTIEWYRSNPALGAGYR